MKLKPFSLRLCAFAVYLSIIFWHFEHNRGEQTKNSLLSSVLMHRVMAAHFCGLPEGARSQWNSNRRDLKRHSCYDVFGSAADRNTCRQTRIQTMSDMVLPLRFLELLVLYFRRQFCNILSHNRFHGIVL